MEKILLIDGSNLLYRAYYATENKQMLSPTGVDVNAIHTVISLLKKYIDMFEPKYIFVALDEGKETFRHNQYGQYKGHRPETPQRLKNQFGLIRELYKKMGIFACGHPEYEADDLIATVAKIAKNNDLAVQIISSDKDLLQTIDENVSMFVPKSNKFGKDINYTPAIFEEKYGVKVDEWILYKALVGDSSDNIIGVKKIGDKTAVSLINQYHDAHSIINAARDGELKPAQNKNILEDQEILLRNIQLVKLVDDIDIEFNLNDLKFDGYSDEVLEFLHEHGMNRHLSTFQKLLGKKDVEIKCNYKFIDEFNSQYIDDENYIYTQTLDDNYFTSQPLGFGIVNQKGVFYLPFDRVNDQFIAFLQDEHKKITYDLKQLMGILKLTEVGNFICDIKIANSVLNNDNYKKSFDFICLEYKIDGVYPYTTIYGSKTNPQLDWDKVYVDIVSKAKALPQLFINIMNQLEISNLSDVYYNIEHPLITVLARMEINGILFDTNKLVELKNEYEVKMQNILNEISKITDININSPKQLSDYLFNENEIDPKGIKKTTNGYTTDQATLTALLARDDIEPRIKTFLQLTLDYRQVNKIYATYLVGLEKFVINGYLHPIYQQLLTETGRLSATKPNIQNIPVRSDEGKEIRSLFPALDGTKFATFDYSQIELRVIAQLSQDKNMIETFNKHLDIHEMTAKKVFNVESITSDERRKAKAINFGIIYGIGAHGLAQQIDSTNQEAKKIIDDYFKAFPQIKSYQEQVIKDSFAQGYIKTLFNRVRKINTNVTKHKDVEALKRICINTPIQGTAADIIKKAMIVIDKYIREKHPDVKMIMQIHDELIFYIPDQIVDQVTIDIKNIMEHIVKFDIPLEVDYGIANNWKDAK